MLRNALLQAKQKTYGIATVGQYCHVIPDSLHAAVPAPAWQHAAPNLF